jgi:hypothetical protein
VSDYRTILSGHQKTAKRGVQEHVDLANEAAFQPELIRQESKLI